MRSRRPLITAVLAVALLVGQWLAAGHETEHSLQPGAAHACAICVFAHGAGAGALPASPALSEALLQETAVATGDSARTQDAIRRTHPIRGPPSFLV